MFDSPHGHHEVVRTLTLNCRLEYGKPVLLHITATRHRRATTMLRLNRDIGYNSLNDVGMVVGVFDGLSGLEEL